ncbi:phosphopantetheine-binding protein [Pendulispora albinea]|uniref:Phosphopantetheine-binding protein n=1 Tax=Pendulispora albinea TaxID=2741071 RepID=A0ABZ2LWJ9_9BACT
MTNEDFTFDDLKRILLVSAGFDDSIPLDGSMLDADFAELGYDSVALLETWRRIELERRIAIDDSTAAGARTPRALLAIVNAHLPTVEGSASRGAGSTIAGATS